MYVTGFLLLISIQSNLYRGAAGMLDWGNLKYKHKCAQSRAPYTLLCIILEHFQRSISNRYTQSFFVHKLGVCHSWQQSDRSMTSSVNVGYDESSSRKPLSVFKNVSCFNRSWFIVEPTSFFSNDNEFV